jgi:ABC-type molybdate transport system permease subunit
LNQPGGEAPAARLVLISVLLSLAAMVASETVSQRLRRR